ncbi:hypothetical protein BD289DRAFT_483877 [Coniella lustricola]|uniref:L-lactate dehydrogenase n=1 Tax=Coniella lustricola TaxID=2025994 RepID=A0A2T3A404_9PEZI|nr:hypothetical protein BD289DRAFT_483877 [Coniella lustricola]
MSPSSSLTSRIAVVGAGEVGATIAYSLLLSQIASEIVLVDPQEAVRDAQIQDLSDASYEGGTTTTVVRAGTHKEAGQCDIVVMTAGAKQKKGESRTDLVGRNLAILQSSIDDMKPFARHTVLLLVTNPVDVLTHFAQHYAGLPRAQVIGSGTALDSARLRGILARQLGVAASSVHAFVLGEHGESQVVAWSRVAVGGIPLDQTVLSSPSSSSSSSSSVGGPAKQGAGHSVQASLDKAAIGQETRDKAAAIIEAKGSTAFGIGGVASSLCRTILYDQRDVVPVSHYQEDLQVCLSTPVVLGRKGIVQRVDMKLESEEREALVQSAERLREVIEEAQKE